MNNRLTIIVFSILFVSVFYIVTAKSESNEPVKIEIKEWFKTSTFEIPLPAFHNIKNLKGTSITVEDILEFEQYDISKWWPSKGKESNREPKWEIMSSDEQGYVNILSKNKAIPEIAYIATYIHTSRWMKIQLTATSPHLFQLYVDGNKVKTKSNSEKDDQKEAVKTEVDLKLETGKHLILFKLLRDPKNQMPWHMKTTLSTSEKIQNTDIVLLIGFFY